MENSKVKQKKTSKPIKSCVLEFVRKRRRENIYKRKWIKYAWLGKQYCNKKKKKVEKTKSCFETITKGGARKEAKFKLYIHIHTKGHLIHISLTHSLSLSALLYFLKILRISKIKKIIERKIEKGDRERQGGSAEEGDNFWVWRLLDFNSSFYTVISLPLFCLVYFVCSSEISDSDWLSDLQKFNAFWKQ